MKRKNRVQLPKLLRLPVVATELSAHPVTIEFQGSYKGKLAFQTFKKGNRIKHIHGEIIFET